MMSTVTYSDPTMQQFIEDYFIPVQINVKQEPAAMTRFNLCWTPTLLVQDEEGREHRKSEGFFNPQALRGELALGYLKAMLNRGRYGDAKALLVHVAAHTKDDKAREPELLYWTGVTHYRADHDTNKLKETWSELLDRFPESDWATRASIVRK